MIEDENMVFKIEDAEKLRIKYLTGEEIHLLNMLRTSIHH